MKLFRSSFSASSSFYALIPKRILHTASLHSLHNISPNLRFHLETDKPTSGGSADYQMSFARATCFK